MCTRSLSHSVWRRVFTPTVIHSFSPETLSDPLSYSSILCRSLTLPFCLLLWVYACLWECTVCMWVRLCVFLTSSVNVYVFMYLPPWMRCVCVHASALIGGCAIIRVCVSSSVCTCIFQNVSVCICMCPRVCAYHPEYVCVPLSVNVCVFPWTYLCVFLDECLPMFVGVVCVSVSLLSLSLSFFLYPADFILHGLVSYQYWIFPVNNVKVVAGEL